MSLSMISVGTGDEFEIWSKDFVDVTKNRDKVFV